MPAYTTRDSKLHPHQNSYTVTGLEHSLREAFSIGGAENGLERALDNAESQKEKDLIVVDYIRGKQSILSGDLIDALLPIVESTLDFYDDLEQSLSSRAQRASERLKYNEISFETHMVVGDDTNLNTISDEKNPIQVSDLNPIYPLDHTNSDEDSLDVTLPTVLMCAHSERKTTSIYPFVPNDDVLTCTCGDKQKNAGSPLCFHEIAALLKMSTYELEPDGPDTWVQMVSPTSGLNE